MDQPHCFRPNFRAALKRHVCFDTSCHSVARWDSWEGGGRGGCARADSGPFQDPSFPKSGVRHTNHPICPPDTCNHCNVRSHSGAMSAIIRSSEQRVACIPSESMTSGPFLLLPVLRVVSVDASAGRTALGSGPKTWATWPSRRTARRPAGGPVGPSRPRSMLHCSSDGPPIPAAPPYLPTQRDKRPLGLHTRLKSCIAVHHGRRPVL